ncbi:hypothetical protein GEMRC1_013556 [Eukaryota sp. GEM-RC1]
MKQSGNDIYCHPNNGPTFGPSPFDLVINNNANSTNSTCNPNRSYECPTGYSDFVGESSFSLSEYEVYTVTLKSINTEFQNSTILNGCDQDIGFVLPQMLDTPRLLFRASRDGYTAANFHSKCDNQANVLVLFKTNTGAIGGGYSTTAFDSSGQYKLSPGAFLFRLVNSNGASPRKFNLKGTTVNDIYCNSGYGPTFGGNHDLYVVNNCQSSNSSCNLGHTYEGTYTEFIGGSSFRITDYEVYQLIVPQTKSTDFDSTILKSTHNLQVLGLTGKPTLLFRGSRDGFASSTFHQRCDGHANVFVVFSTTKGAIAGGFTHVAFKNSGSYQQSPGAFLLGFKIQAITVLRSIISMVIVPTISTVIRRMDQHLVVDMTFIWLTTVTKTLPLTAT